MPSSQESWHLQETMTQRCWGVWCLFNSSTQLAGRVIAKQTSLPLATCMGLASTIQLIFTTPLWEGYKLYYLWWKEASRQILTWLPFQLWWMKACRNLVVELRWLNSCCWGSDPSCDCWKAQRKNKTKTQPLRNPNKRNANNRQIFRCQLYRE